LEYLLNFSFIKTRLAYGKNIIEMRTNASILLPPTLLKLRKLVFFYFKYFVFLLNKFKILNPLHKQLITLFVDLTTESSYLVRTFCIKFKHAFILNRWLFGFITNRFRILTKAKRLLNDEVFFYNYKLPRYVPQLIFFINSIYQRQFVEEEISTLNCPVIYIIQHKENVIKLKKNYFLIFFYESHFRLIFYLVFFCKLLKYFR